MDLKRVKIEGLQIFKIDKSVYQKVNLHTPEPIASETQKARKKIKKGEGNLFFMSEDGEAHQATTFTHKKKFMQDMLLT